MKKLFLSLLLVGATSFLSAQTTQEEYTYITKGMVRHYTEGADMKTGYSMSVAQKETKFTWGNGEWRSATLWYFKKGTVTKAIVIDCADHAGNRRFLCVPTSTASKEVWDQSYSELKTVGESWDFVILWAMTKIVSNKLL